MRWVTTALLASSLALLASAGARHANSKGYSEGESDGAPLPAATRAADASNPVAPDFVLDVQPVLTAAGCNAGGCHGAALGQSGFKLSLYGHEPRSDWEALTRELGGRRVDLAVPAQSLALRKPSRQLPHRGGRALPRESEGFAIVERWIDSGAPYRTQSRELEALSLEGPDELRVVARFDDGSQRDVTRWTRFESNDESIARVDDGGRIVRLRAGQTSVVARYGDQVAIRTVVIPFGEVEFDFEERNFVDEHVARRWRALGVLPAEVSGDLAFLRRATLDLTGRLPSIPEIQSFELDPDHEELVERLMASEAFTDYWGYRLAELFPASLDLVKWLRAELRAGRSWDELAGEMIAASERHPGTALFRSNDPKLMAEGLFSSFLGKRIHCAQCHNHPFMTFRQRDYIGITAFFARVRMERGALLLAKRGEVRLPGTQEVVPPSLPGLGAVELAPDGERRGSLAAWVVAQDEFAEALVNRIWRELLGAGLFEPVDDRRATNPATNEALLGALAADFRASGYALRRPIEMIAKSAVYGRRRTPRLMPAEVLHDAIADVTGVKDARRAVLEPTLESELLDVSGRRTEFQGSLAQSLYFLTSESIQNKLQQMTETSLEQLYLRALCRRPTDAELALEPRTREEFEDLVWALLSSAEFNHVE